MRHLTVTAVTVASIVIFGIALVVLAKSPGGRGAPCDEFADYPINSVPARCAEHFGVTTTTENGDQ